MVGEAFYWNGAGGGLDRGRGVPVAGRKSPKWSLP